MELISILISIYQEKIDWIELSIRSVLGQTYTNLEFIIIVDDPGRNDIIPLLNSLFKNDKRRYKIISNLNNVGLTKSLNIGLNFCNGDFIARMDADDISFSTRLEKQMIYLKTHPDVLLCGTGIIEFDDKCNFNLISYPQENEAIINRLILEPSFAHPTLLINKRKIERNGFSLKYDESYVVSQDYKLYVDLIGKIKFGNLDEPLLFYRRSFNQVTSKRRNLQLYNARLCSLSVINKVRQNMEKESGVYYNLKIVKWLSLNEYNILTVIKFIFSLDWRYFSFSQLLAFFKRVLKGPKSLSVE